MPDERSARRIQSVEQTFDILEILRDYDGLTLTKLAEKVGLSPSTTHTYLETMRERGYIREKDGVYNIGFSRFQSQNMPVLKRNCSLLRDQKSMNFPRPLVRSFTSLSRVGVKKFHCMNRLAKKQSVRTYSLKSKAPTNESSLLGCRESNSRSYGYQISKRHTGRYPFPRRTKNTITEEQSLLAELDEIRQNGIALNNEEQVEGLRAVGPVIQKEAQILGAVSLSAPSTHLSGEKFRTEFPERVERTANIIEVDLESLE